MRRASVAMILRMRPSPDLVFEGHEPKGWTGSVVKREDWGLGLGLDDFFRLRRSDGNSEQFWELMYSMGKSPWNDTRTPLH
jgi:hypothetical protein